MKKKLSVKTDGFFNSLWSKPELKNHKPPGIDSSGLCIIVHGFDYIEGITRYNQLSKESDLIQGDSKASYM